MSRPITTEHRINFTFYGDDGNAYQEFALEFECLTYLGQAESGTSGPPEHYDPGSGAEITLGQLTTNKTISPDAAVALAQAWLENNRDAVEDLAVERAQGEYEAVMEARAEARRDA